MGKLIIRESTNLFVIQSVVVCTVAFRFLTDFFMFKRTVPREYSLPWIGANAAACYFMAPKDHSHGF